MIIIRDINNKVVSRSQNLRGIREYVRVSPVQHVRIQEAERGTGILHVTYENGATALTVFASFVVLHSWISRWRSAYGALLTINRNPAGTLRFRP